MSGGRGDEPIFLATMMGCLVQRAGGELRIPKSEWYGLAEQGLAIAHDRQTGDLVARLTKAKS